MGALPQAPRQFPPASFWRSVTRTRRWVPGIAAAGSIVLLLFGAATAAALASRFGPTRALIDAVERQLDPSDSLRYDIHRALGKVLSFCPCTAGLSREQYGRAAYHRPRPILPPSAP